jgi:hypothetical protein
MGLFEVYVWVRGPQTEGQRTPTTASHSMKRSAGTRDCLEGWFVVSIRLGSIAGGVRCNGLECSVHVDTGTSPSQESGICRLQRITFIECCRS